MVAQDIAVARNAAVAAMTERIRRICSIGDVTRPALDSVKHELLQLAAAEHLFPTAEFPPPPAGEKRGRRYLLRQDADGQFALYIVALNPGNETKPHDHTTWAVVVALEGQELNKVYRCTDESGRPDHAPIVLDHEVIVEPGRGIALMPEDIHSIHTTGSAPTRHLHMYGLALEKLDKRMAYDAETGRAQPYNAAFMRPTATSPA